MGAKMFESIKDRIGIVKNSATKSETVLIDFLETAFPRDIVYSSITELAEMVGVAEATILRFCKKLGLKGYQEFKLLIAQDMARYTNSSNVGYAEMIAENMINCIKDTLALINYTDMEKAAELIINAKKSFVMGCGNSGLAALEMINKLMRAGVHIGVATDPHFQAIVASTLCSSDTLILVSVSGSTKDILNRAATAAQANARIVVISNHIKSPLAKFADVMLPSVRKEAPHDGGSLVTKISQIFTIDVLCGTIIKKLGPQADQAIKKTATSITDKII
jgi:DNA-binding MurR/RpiR family transcriptional regulator